MTQYTERSFDALDTYLNATITTARNSNSYQDVRDTIQAGYHKIRQQLGGLKVTTPKDHGAVGGALFGYTEASYDAGTKTLTISGRTFDSSWVGAVVGYGGQESTVASIDGSGNIITTDTLTVNNTFWYVGRLNSEGKDATEAFNAAIAALNAEKGGTLSLAGDVYLVSLSQTDYLAGTNSAIVIDKDAGTPISIEGGGTSANSGTIIFRYGSYGDCIGNVHDDETDFVSISNLRLETVSFNKVVNNHRECAIRFVSPLGNFTYATDAHIFIDNVQISYAGTHGIHYTGRGNVNVRGCNILNAAGNGIFFDDTYDNKIIDCTIGAPDLCAVRCHKSPSTIITGGKYFYTGKAGDTDLIDSAAIAITGDQWRHGCVIVSDLILQECIGGIYTNVGNNTFSDIDIQGCGRQTIRGVGSTVPSVVSFIYLDSGEARMNLFNNVKLYGFPLFEDQNSDDGDSIFYWGDTTHLVYITGSTSGLGGDLVLREYGAQENKGDIHYSTQTVDSDFNLDYGPSLSNTYHGSDVIVAAGGGHNNGLNTGLSINGTALT